MDPSTFGLQSRDRYKRESYPDSIQSDVALHTWRVPKEKDRHLGRAAALLGALVRHPPFGATLRWLQPNYQLFEFIFGPLDFLLDRIDGGVYGPPVVGIRGNRRQLSAAEARAHAILDTINSPDPGAYITLTEMRELARPAVGQTTIL